MVVVWRLPKFEIVGRGGGEVGLEFVPRRREGGRERVGRKET